MPNEKKLLFVDDDRTMLDMLSRRLEQCGEDWEGEFRLSVGEALEALHRTRFDAVVEDMPMMNGKQSTARIEKMKPDIKTLFMSGSTVEIIAQCGVLTEGVNFVHKLFAIEEPLTKVRAALKNEAGRSNE